MFTIEELIKVAKEKGASDLHITVGISPVCRVNGELIMMGYEKILPSDMITLLKPIFNQKTEKLFDEQGEIDLPYSVPDLVRCRVNIFKQRGSYACVIRLHANMVPSPEELGIPASIVDITNKKKGLVLVTGPAGCGKSSTLASLIDVINSNYSAHIITLEDPIEYLHSHKKAVVNQREIGVDTLSYANALHAALREDPDVIMVGDMKDLETISTAITAAETGHLVFASLYTTGVANTIDRIIDVFPPHQQQLIRVQLSYVLESVVSQQLIPTADGKSRIAAYEVMHCTPAIKNLIRDGKTNQITSMIQGGKKQGMQTMDDAIFDLYLQRSITAEMAINFAQDSTAIEKKIH